MAWCRYWKLERNLGGQTKLECDEDTTILLFSNKGGVLNLMCTELNTDVSHERVKQSWLCIVFFRIFGQIDWVIRAFHWWLENLYLSLFTFPDLGFLSH